MIVRPTSRIVSAISLGVFWRSAPSTSAIIRSRKPCPGLTVTRTRISSEMTRVPAVTAERSPPASRITGALSPVIAASLTERRRRRLRHRPGSDRRFRPARDRRLATGWPARATRPDREPGRRRQAAWPSVRPWCRAARRPAPCRVLRRCASAKLPNSTVSHSQTTSWSLKAKAQTVAADKQQQGQQGGDHGGDEHHRVARPAGADRAS